MSGVKKWITNGVYADYFTTLCQTELFGPSMLLVERDEDEIQVQTKLIKTSYSPAAGTYLCSSVGVRVYVMIEFVFER